MKEYPKCPPQVHPVIQAKSLPCLLLVQNGEILFRAELPKDFENKFLLNAMANPEKAYKKAKKMPEFEEAVREFEAENGPYKEPNLDL